MSCRASCASFNDLVASKPQDVSSFAQIHWQAGYATFSVSESSLRRAARYIEDQEEHHRVTTFQDEYRALLKKHGQKWDEAYVWD
jgi:putative transposase